MDGVNRPLDMKRYVRRVSKMARRKEEKKRRTEDKAVR